LKPIRIHNTVLLCTFRAAEREKLEQEFPALVKQESGPPAPSSSSPVKEVREEGGSQQDPQGAAFIGLFLKIIKRKNSTVKVGIDNLAHFFSISPNQPKLLPSVCLVPGLDFPAIPVSISAMSLGSLSTFIIFRF
jgi:hypothetical protein